MATIDVSPEDMLAVGLNFIGVDVEKTRNVSNATNLDRFRSAYGVSPAVCSIIFTDIQQGNETTINKPIVKHYLMALNWLKRYQVETMMSSIFNLHEQTIRTKVRLYVQAIQSLKHQKIVWRDNVNQDIENNNQQVGVSSWLLSVDGTHCRIKEPRSVPDKDWYSHKHHKPCVAYELGINLFDSRLVWVNGPFKAGDTDLLIFRKPDGLKAKLEAVNRHAIGNKGYCGKDCVSTPNKFDTKQANIFKRRARARHEDFNGRLKNFAVLGQQFRHAIDKHKCCFEAVCVLVQYSLENGNPLLEV